MEKIQLYQDTYAFIFDELIPYKTIVYVILRNNTAIFIDSFLGENYIQDIIQTFENKLNHYEFILINTHYHFDHILGNQFFKNCKIYAHELCVTNIQTSIDNDLKLYKEYIPDHFILTLPNHVFKDAVILKELNLKIIYTPGHSNDCISIEDTLNHAIYVGDNLEKPLIQLDSNDIDTYIKTLLSYNSKSIYASHTLNITHQDICNTIYYLKNIRSISFNDHQKQKIHSDNISILNKPII